MHCQTRLQVGGASQDVIGCGIALHERPQSVAAKHSPQHASNRFTPDEHSNAQ